jgi:hypothetical protein
MKKIVSRAKKVVSTEVVTPASAESVSAVVPVAAPAVKSAPAAAPAPSVVTTMTDPAVQECTSLLDQVIAKLGAQQALDTSGIRRATKMRKGGAEVIPKILALCLQHKVTQIGTLTTQEMSDELERGNALEQVGLRGALVQKKVKDSAMGAHGRSWQIGMTMYRTLQRMALNDPELALGLADVESFFQTKRTKGKVRANKRASAASKAAKAAASAATTGAEPAAAGAVPAATTTTTTAAGVPAGAAPVAASDGHAGAAAGGGAAAAAPAVQSGAGH